MNELSPIQQNEITPNIAQQSEIGALLVAQTAVLELDQPPYILSRDEKLRLILPYDYDYAVESGLIDMFYLDEENNKDGLLHTLIGTQVSGPMGIVAEGYHHEESGLVLSPRMKLESGEVVSSTRVDLSHLDGANRKKRVIFSRYPGDYYNSRVIVENRPKISSRRDPDTGEVTELPTNNGMYPEAYDALAVLQTIRLAFESRDPKRDELRSSATLGSVLMNQAEVPLMDGKSSITIRLIMDPTTHKIHTAIPVVNGPKMKLTKEQLDAAVVNIWEH